MLPAFEGRALKGGGEFQRLSILERKWIISPWTFWWVCLGLLEVLTIFG